MATTPNYKEADPVIHAALTKLITSDRARYTREYIGAQVGELCDHGTYSGSYVSTYLSKSHWTGSEFEPALASWLKEHASELQRRRRDFWVRNPVADQIKLWIDYAIAEGKVVAITGDSGIGKTETIDHCLADKMGVFRIQCSPARKSSGDLINTMVDQIGPDHIAFASARNKADGIVRYFLEFSHLIVLDDFDLLIRSGYEFLLRDLWNQTRLGDKTVPQFWAGNEEGIARIRSLSPQLRGRIRHVKLNTADCFSPKFVREFMSHHLEEVAPTPAMISAGTVIANLPGSAHLRTLRDLCREVRYQVTRLDDDPNETFFDNWEASDDARMFKSEAPALLKGIERAALTGKTVANPTRQLAEATA
jgi:energy-coupling factor transporter ATP-binding protein EcfA2